jgi:hypothetical protein
MESFVVKALMMGTIECVRAYALYLVHTFCR